MVNVHAPVHLIDWDKTKASPGFLPPIVPCVRARVCVCEGNCSLSRREEKEHAAAGAASPLGGDGMHGESDPRRRRRRGRRNLQFSVVCHSGNTRDSDRPKVLVYSNFHFGVDDGKNKLGFFFSAELFWAQQQPFLQERMHTSVVKGSGALSPSLVRPPLTSRSLALSGNGRSDSLSFSLSLPPSSSWCPWH